MALGIKPDGRREILGFWLFGAEGGSAGNREEVLKDLRRCRVQRVRIFISDDLPGLEEAEEALRNLRERWGGIYSKIVERWETKAYALLALLRHPKPIRRYLYTTNQLERLAKEVKRQSKVVEVFCGEEAVAKLLYLVLSHLDEAWGARRLRGFAEIQTGSYHADQTY